MARKNSVGKNTSVRKKTTARSSVKAVKTKSKIDHILLAAKKAGLKKADIEKLKDIMPATGYGIEPPQIKKHAGLFSPFPKASIEHPAFSLYGSALKYYQQASDQSSVSLRDKSPDAVQHNIIQNALEKIKKGHELFNNGTPVSTLPSDASAPRAIEGFLSENSLARLSNSTGESLDQNNLPNQITVPFSSILELVPGVSLTATEKHDNRGELSFHSLKVTEPTNENEDAGEGENEGNTCADNMDVKQYVCSAIESAKLSSTDHNDKSQEATRQPPELLRDLAGNASKQEIVSAADATAYYDFFDLRIAWEPVWTEALGSDFRQWLEPEHGELVRFFLPQFNDLATWEKYYQYCGQHDEALDELLSAAAHYKFLVVGKRGVNTEKVDEAFLTNELPTLSHLMKESETGLRETYLYYCSWSDDPGQNGEFLAIFLEASFKNLRNEWSLTIDALPAASKQEFDYEMPAKLSKRGYPFKIFTPGTINYGLLVNYRQQWTPEEWQVGDLVKTVPLAPKEVRKFKTIYKENKKHYRKELEKAQRSRRSEDATTQRSESEIIDRANESTGFKTEVNGGVNFAVWNVGGSTSLGIDSAHESSATKQGFREAVTKAAREVKSERQIELVEEESSSFEVVATSEISNPNDEVTVTYLYYELQRQYSIVESIHKVDAVVLVAEEVTAKSDINEAWIRKYEWILRRVLLDDAFEEILDEVRIGKTTLDAEIKVLKNRMDKLNKLLEKAAENLSSLNQGVTVAQEAIRQAAERIFYINESGSGWVEGAQAAEGVIDYNSAVAEGLGKEINKVEDLADTRRSAVDRAVDDYNKAVRKQEKRKYDVERILEHVRDNILYYQQSIWSHESPEQRYMRLFNRSVPFFDYPESNTEIVIEFDEPVVSVESLAAETPFRVVLPPPSPPVDRRLDEIADLNTLLGFKGNYFIFPLRRQSFISAYMAQNYYEAGDVAVDPDGSGQAEYLSVHEIRNIATVEREWLQVSKLLGRFFTENELNNLKEQLSVLVPVQQWKRFKEMLRLRLNKQQWRSFVLELSHLMSHEEWTVLKVLLGDASHEDTKTVRTSLEQWARGGKLKTPTKPEKIVVPMNGLYLEALVGQHPILEPFKRKHRDMDVKKVEAEVFEQRIENIRLEARLLNLDLDDPQIDKNVRFEGIDLDKLEHSVSTTTADDNL